MDNTINISVSHLSMGKRLKLLRSLTGLTAEQLAKLSNLSRQSISYWENGGGFSSKSAEKIIEAMISFGYNVSVTWLLFGIGDFPALKKEIPPVPLPTVFPDMLEGMPVSNAPGLESEIELFKFRHADTITLSVNTNTMYPILCKGDVVGGIWRPASSILGHPDCIIEYNNQYEIRKVKKVSDEHFDLMHLCYEASPNAFLIKKVRLAKIAPIIRVWRGATWVGEEDKMI